MDLISLIILIIGCTWQAMPLGGDEGRDGEEEGKQSKCGGGARWKILLFPLIGRMVRLLLVVLKPWNSMLVPSFRERLKFNKLLAHWSAPHVLLFDRCQSAAGSVRFYVSVRMWASIYQGFFFSPVWLTSVAYAKGYVRVFKNWDVVIDVCRASLHLSLASLVELAAWWSGALWHRHLHARSWMRMRGCVGTSSLLCC